MSDASHVHEVGEPRLTTTVAADDGAPSASSTIPVMVTVTGTGLHPQTGVGRMQPTSTAAVSDAATEMSRFVW